MVFDQDGNLYFSSGLSAAFKVNPLTGTVLARYNVSDPFGVAIQGNTLFIAEFSQISEYNTITNEYLGVFTQLADPIGRLAFAPNGNLYGATFNQIRVFAPNGSLVNQFDVASASGLTFGEDGDLYILTGAAILRYSLDGTFLNTVATLNTSLTYSDLAFGPSVSVPEPTPMFTTLLIGGIAIGLAWRKQRKKNA